MKYQQFSLKTIRDELGPGSLKWLDIYLGILGKDGTPSRRDISFTDLKLVLPQVQLLEKIGDGPIMNKVTGTEVRDTFHYESSGDEYSKFYDADDWAKIELAFENLHSVPCGCYNRVRWNVKNRSLTIFHSVLSLPILSDPDGVPQLIMVSDNLNSNQEKILLSDPAVEIEPKAQSVDIYYIDLGFGLPANAG